MERASARHSLVQKFPLLPATTIDAVLAAHGGDESAAIAHLLSFAEATGSSRHGVDAFSRLALDQEFIEALVDTHLGRQTLLLRRELWNSRPGQQAPPARALANVLLSVNRNVARAKEIVLSGDFRGALLKQSVDFPDPLPWTRSCCVQCAGTLHAHWQQASRGLFFSCTPPPVPCMSRVD